MSIQDAPAPAPISDLEERRAEFQGRGVRLPEWVVLGFFAYLVAISLWFNGRPHLHYQPVAILVSVAAIIAALVMLQRTRFAWLMDCIRDWIPMGLTLVAFRSMELFIPSQFSHPYERLWVGWDHVLLGNWGLRSAIESLGSLIPGYLELCYLLVYGVGTYCLLILYLTNNRRRIDSFYAIYLAGTLGAYALFPYFPSQPPRILFPQIDPPTVDTIVRHWNLWILRNGTIHSSVFPSAHVSSAFAAAWAMLVLMPHRKRYGWGLVIYAVSVALATIYGRYHYAADAAAGIAISVVAAGLFLAARRRR